MRLLAIAALAALGGCASLQITYQSDPQGATLYQDGQPIGVTPYTLTYEPSEAFREGGCMSIRETAVKWASGATASTSGVLVVCKSTGERQTYTFIRPDVPGRDIDVNYALQRQRNGILAQQLILQQQAAQRPIIPPMTFQPVPVYQMPQPINCQSYRLGNTVQTNCH